MLQKNIKFMFTIMALFAGTATSILTADSNLTQAQKCQILKEIEREDQIKQMENDALVSALSKQLFVLRKLKQEILEIIASTDKEIGEKYTQELYRARISELPDARGMYTVGISPSSYSFQNQGTLANVLHTNKTKHNQDQHLTNF